MSLNVFRKRLATSLLILPLMLITVCAERCEAGAHRLGADYAFLVLMTMSPDFSAADYTITNDQGSDVDVTISRLPLSVDLMSDPESRLYAEVSAAYQQTEQIVETFPGPGEYIDARWITKGAKLGLVHEQKWSENVRFTQNARFGIVKLKNNADYYGPLTESIRGLYDGTLLNWEADASISTLGVGLGYTWTLLDRISNVKADLFHAIVDSFNEDNDDLKFTENATMLSVKADMIFPSGIYIYDQRIDFVLMGGWNQFFGENRHTLGYSSSYQAGLGAEVPLHWNSKLFGYLRLSGQGMWADNMRGGLVSLGYSHK
jgi:hypothetical protein